MVFVMEPNPTGGVVRACCTVFFQKWPQADEPQADSIVQRQRAKPVTYWPRQGPASKVTCHPEGSCGGATGRLANCWDVMRAVVEGTDRASAGPGQLGRKLSVRRWEGPES